MNPPLSAKDTNQKVAGRFKKPLKILNLSGFFVFWRLPKYQGVSGCPTFLRE